MMKNGWLYKETGIIIDNITILQFYSNKQQKGLEHPPTETTEYFSHAV